MRKLVLLCVLTLGAAASPVIAHAQQILAQESFTIPAGSSGSTTSDMVYASYNNNGDGWGWSGGAGSVQGANALHYYTSGNPTHVVASNEALSFSVGSTVDFLNAHYGAGKWTIANATLTFASSYAIQRSTRFGQGSGGFSIYWVANNNWFENSGVQADNPVYATSQAALLPWAGQASLLASGYFTDSGSGNVNLSYTLALDPNFVEAILNASAQSGNPAVSLYLMATDNNIGMLIFTGGPGDSAPAPPPTLSFDVVAATPASNAPAMSATGFVVTTLALSVFLGLIGIRKKYFDPAD